MRNLSPKGSSLTQMARLVTVVTALASIHIAAEAQVSVQVPSNVVETGTNAWHYLVMEGESYVDASKVADASTSFTKVYNDAALTSFYGGPILATNTSASMQGALYTQTTFGPWGDKVTYQVSFSTPGDYYLYMRFT